MNIFKGKFMKKLILLSASILLSTASFAQINIGPNGVSIGGQQQQGQGNVRYEDDERGNEKHKGGKHNKGPSNNASSRALEVHDMKERGMNPGRGKGEHYQEQQKNQQQGVVIDNNGIKLPGITIK